MRIRWQLPLRILVALTLCATTTLAEPGASPPSSTTDAQTKDLAKQHLDRGVLAFREGRYKDAIDQFLEANRTYPSASTSFNIAKAYEKLGDDAGALSFFRDYLRRDPTATDRDLISARIGELEDQLRLHGVQQVTVLSKPDGATVVLDGRPVGVTPWTSEILPGFHNLTLQRSGYADKKQSFELQKHRSLEVSGELHPLSKLAAAGTLSAATNRQPAANNRQPAANNRQPAANNRQPAAEKASVAKNSEHSASKSTANVLPWLVLGGAGATLGAAGYFELSSRSSEDEARKALTQAQALGHIHDMQAAQTTARVLVGVGGALAITGGVLLYMQPHESGSKEQIAWGCGLWACSIKGSF